MSYKLHIYSPKGGVNSFLRLYWKSRMVEIFQKAENENYLIFGFSDFKIRLLR